MNWMIQAKIHYDQSESINKACYLIIISTLAPVFSKKVLNIDQWMQLWEKYCIQKLFVKTFQLT